MELETLNGSDKAAVLILALPDEMAKDFLGELDDDEVERVLQSIARIQEVPQEVKDQVLNEFRDAITRREQSISGGKEKAVSLIEQHLEPHRGNRTLGIFGKEEKRVDWVLRPFEPDFIAQTIANEHPQTIALVISELDEDRAAKVLSELPEIVRSDVILRLATLESVAKPMLEELAEGLQELFGQSYAGKNAKMGVETAARLLNKVRKTESEIILESLDENDPQLSGEIRKRMLTFHDLISLDSRGMQALLREVPTEDLVVALKTAGDEMRDKIFSNVSSRAAAQIREDLELLPPMKLSEVEVIQQQVVDIARRLQEDGVLSIAAGGGDDVMV